jgi:hypothetical protein
VGVAIRVSVDAGVGVGAGVGVAIRVSVDAGVGVGAGVGVAIRVSVDAGVSALGLAQLVRINSPATTINNNKVLI